ncbi:transcriptional regulator, TetR family [Rathayibacter oskolensis]|uniref:Transcriptional regulator, TetR family n=1 Tax=Rathayibacter oskolensis TaxID=1891671 RepID=A0A1X7PHR8_9MICO|nr:TetR/AcrR family transcriptional regulator [Rathayibacter oskolensis]SMH51018.1 transcriptional regulator, TetR family [Rathayibacter oskolensis]
MRTTTNEPGTRSTAEQQRRRILGHAVRVFARGGYRATPVADIAAAAEVSPAYVFRLFDGKLGLFVDAVDSCYDQVAAAMTAGAARSSSTKPEAKLDAMRDAYVELITDRDLIALQVHATSACDVPEIRDAVRRGLAKTTEAVATASSAGIDDVQRFMAYGQLCHLIVQADLFDIGSPWARTLSHGIRHL